MTEAEFRKLAKERGYFPEQIDDLVESKKLLDSNNIKWDYEDIPLPEIIQEKDYLLSDHDI